jgi:putative acetyltransferase
MSIRIVPIAETHADSFRECLDAVAREKRYLAQVEAPALESVRAFVRANVAASVAQFVALDGDRVVGWCDILPAWAHAQRHCGALGMGVLAAHRGRGIGRALLSACVAKARANGLSRIELDVRADNEPAISLYERVGFRREGRKHYALRYDDTFFDAISMALVFDA